jgi:uncharacterized repeat protein (TIGR03803 family)
MENQFAFPRPATLLLASVALASLASAAAKAQTNRYLFAGGPLDGEFPHAGLLYTPAAIYGTTQYGGTSGNGTVFKYALPAGPETVLYNFTGGNDGGQPVAGLILEGGNLYGTTSVGGTSGLGTVYKLTLAGVETVVHSFTGSPDGSVPSAGLIYKAPYLYGTTAAGGTAGDGTVFRTKLAGAESVLYSFTNTPDGANPYAGLIYGAGFLYGTTETGGTFGDGTVFKVSLAGIETALYSFAGGADGAYPMAGLLKDGPYLYGTAFQGGGSANCTSGCGTVFKIKPTGANYATIHAFTGYPGDGANPEAGLIRDGALLYGTTFLGGSSSLCSSNNTTSGCGTVFNTTTAGLTTVVVNFNDINNGVWPVAGLIFDGGTLFGTTLAGESTNQVGTLFSIP